MKGESGPHDPILKEAWTKPPKPYTEATLLRAMETAGKTVEDEELRNALKENGIGRPSTRAAIIETLFKRNYIRKERKNLFPTATGKELIGTIQEELLKSAELTGLWEKKLRQIEKGTYNAHQFLDELKQMVGNIVKDVLSDHGENRIATTASTESNNKPALRCPKCKKGTILRGHTAYGCSEYKNGCDFRMSYEEYGKDLTDAQLADLISKMK